MDYVKKNSPLGIGSGYANETVTFHPLLLPQSLVVVRAGQHPSHFHGHY